MMGFNPRPCIRGDLISVSELEKASGFQSTPLHKGRHSLLVGRYVHAWFQSTPLHKGRQLLFPHNNLRNKFQSTPLHKGRHICNYNKFPEMEFQSTPLHKGRHHKSPARRGFSCFNPRPCIRGDVEACLCLDVDPVSIHAPA